MKPLAVVLIVAAGVAAYANSRSGVFVFDDGPAIVANSSIQRLWPIGPVLAPPGDAQTVSGRPLLNLSLALNYALDGLQVRGYHAVNLAIHILAALVLLGILQRTLARGMRKKAEAEGRKGIQRVSGTGGTSGTLHPSFLISHPSPCHLVNLSPCRAALAAAFAIALLWLVHPLQTESVTYIIQRAESLASLFYLLTLYCVIRGAEQEAGHPASPGTPWALWYAAAVLACLLGTATKEITITAPLVVLLYDRTFLAGSFREALRRRWKLYIALAATWALAGYLIASTRLRGQAADLSVASALAYLGSQPGVILYYLRLAFWPHPLCLDYQWPTASRLADILPAALLLAGLLAVTLWGLVKNKAWGFAAACFFILLLPSSSIVPSKDLAVEHRMYLPLAAVLTLVVAGGYAASGWLADRGSATWPAIRLAGGCLLAIICLSMLTLTVLRNKDYQSIFALYQDMADKSPNNFRAQCNFGAILSEQGKIVEALARLERARQLNPTYPEVYYDLGVAFDRCRRPDEAAANYLKTLELNPKHTGALQNLGVGLLNRKRPDEAIACWRKALDINPHDAEVRGNLAAVLANRGQIDEAVEQLGKALDDVPNSARLRRNLGVILLYHQNKPAEALAVWREGVRLCPNDVPLLNSLSRVLATHPDAAVRQGDEAVALAQRAVELSGGKEPLVLDTLAAAYAEQRQFPKALETVQRAMDLAIIQGNVPLTDALRQRIPRYQAEMPLREAK
jgi:protein O-mannosyl-transferase